MNTIAEQTFRCHPAQGEPFRLVAKFSAPKTKEAADGHYSYSICVISFEPLVPERDFPAGNHFQALCLAFEYLRTTLKVFSGEGGRVYWEDTDSLVDLSSSWFGPFPGRKKLGGKWWESLPSVGGSVE